MKKMCSYKFRLYPTPEQMEVLTGWNGQLRFIWNKLLELNQTKYATEKKFVFSNEMQKLLPGFKKEYEWLDAPHRNHYKTKLKISIEPLKIAIKEARAFLCSKPSIAIIQA